MLISNRPYPQKETEHQDWNQNLLLLAWIYNGPIRAETSGANPCHPCEVVARSAQQGGSMHRRVPITRLFLSIFLITEPQKRSHSVLLCASVCSSSFFCGIPSTVRQRLPPINHRKTMENRVFAPATLIGRFGVSWQWHHSGKFMWTVFQVGHLN